MSIQSEHVEILSKKMHVGLQRPNLVVRDMLVILGGFVACTSLYPSVMLLMPITLC